MECVLRRLCFLVLPVLAREHSLTAQPVGTYSVTESMDLAFVTEPIPGILNLSYADKPGNCTAFLVSPSLLVTASHCEPAQGEFSVWSESAKHSDWKGQVGFKSPDELIFRGVTSGRKTIPGNIQVVYRNTSLDFSVMRLSDRAGVERSYLALSGTPVEEAEVVSVLGHPGGMPLASSGQGSAQNRESDEFLFGYNVDTLPGMSGGPVVRAQLVRNGSRMQVVGLHVQSGGINFDIPSLARGEDQPTPLELARQLCSRVFNPDPLDPSFAQCLHDQSTNKALRATVILSDLEARALELYREIREATAL